MKKTCRGTCHTVSHNQKVLTPEVDGQIVFSLVSGTGNCHEAAWMAHIMAARIAKSQGMSQLVIHNTNRHVVNQLNGVWKARSPTMKRFLTMFRQAFAGMTIIHQY